MKRLATRLAAERDAAAGAAVGIVFHGFRPLMLAPFDHPQNVAFLKDVRTRLGVESAFLVVRDYDGLLLSQLNRRLAHLAGNWAFKAGHISWRDAYSSGDLDALQSDTIGGPPPDYEIKPDIEGLTEGVWERTGRFASIWRLFSQVFDRLYIVPYELFVKEPDATIRAIGDKAGTPLHDHPLSSVKLNSLSNRLMIYNPITLNVPADGGSGSYKRGWKDILLPQRAARKRYKSQGEASVRFRFEITDVIEHCKDWGTFIPSGVDCTHQLPEVSADLGQPISFGLWRDQLDLLSDGARKYVMDPVFLERFAEVFAPIFRANYVFFRRRYKEEINLRTVPDAARKIYRDGIATDMREYEDMLARKEVKSVFDA
ncbi:MAG: hypothetical protein AAF667_16105 [Pseudomonadota bacterium]